LSSTDHPAKEFDRANLIDRFVEEFAFIDFARAAEQPDLVERELLSSCRNFREASRSPLGGCGASSPRKLQSLSQTVFPDPKNATFARPRVTAPAPCRASPLSTPSRQ